MALQLHRLVYCSNSLLPAEPEALAREIERILDASRRNNPREDLTGALTFSSGVFAQVIEGETAQIESTFEQRDPRHNRVQVLALDEVDDRAFPDWPMGFVARSREGQEMLSHFAEEAGLADKRAEGERILQAMLAIAEEENGGDA